MSAKVWGKEAGTWRRNIPSKSNPEFPRNPCNWTLLQGQPIDAQTHAVPRNWFQHWTSLVVLSVESSGQLGTNAPR